MSGLTVRFWGTRGSIPTPGRHSEKYGGTTTCLELRHGETRVILDAGSGIRQLGTAWAEEKDGPVRAHLLFTHLHWDHIQGFPFFAPAYRPGNAFMIHGEARPDGGIRDLLSSQMGGAYFPVPLTAMQADLTFADTTPQFEVEGIRVRTIHVPHPGGCLGYRLEAGDSTFVLATDSELDLAALNQDALRADHATPRQRDPALLEFLSGVTMLVIDCQYTDAEYETKRGWGHNSVATVVDLCVQVRPDTVILFHHDPERTDAQVAAMAGDVSARLERAGVLETLVLPARERLAMQVRKPIRPLPLPH